MRTTFFSLIFILSFIPVFSQEYNLNFANSYGNISSNRGYDLASDPYGNTYVTGTFSGILEFGGESENASGSYDLFLAKYDKDGGLEWVHKAGGSTSWTDFGVSICIDDEGNCILTGKFRGSASFYDSSFNDTTLVAYNDGYDAFIIKYDPSGNRLWLKQIGGNDTDSGNKVIHDSNNNIYLLGTFSSDTIICDKDTKLTHDSYGALALLQFNPSGNLTDAEIIAEYVSDRGKNIGMSIDKLNNIYIAGTFGYSVIKGVTITPNEVLDIVIFKMDQDGNLEWLDQIGGKGTDFCASMSYDDKANLYIAGQFQDSVYFGERLLVSADSFYIGTTVDLYVANIDTAGNVLWATAGVNAGDVQVNDMDISSQGEIYIIGRFEDSLIFDNQTIVSNGLYDIFISKFDSMGNHIYSRAYGGSSESLFNDHGYGIDLDKADNLCITGSYNGTIDLNTTRISSTGQADIYLIKWDKCTSDISIQRNVCDYYISPGGKTWTSTGIYRDTISNSSGCDSIITVDLLVTYSSFATIDETACDTYTSPGGKVWTISGVYNDTIPNSAGCDSVLTINLNILNSSYTNMNITACNSYISPGGQTWTQSGSFTDTLTNTVGCDSIINIDLTIDYSSSGTIDTVACNSYISPSGLYTWNTSGTYQDTIPNAQGCDSTITINLTVEEIDNSVIQTDGILTAVQSNASYQWLSCNTGFIIEGETNQSFTPVVSGIYAVILSTDHCELTSPCYTVSISGLRDKTRNSILLYPNPVINDLYIDFTREYPSVDCKIMDIYGRLLIHREYSDQSVIFLELEQLNEGIYFLMIRLDTEEVVFKIHKN